MAVGFLKLYRQTLENPTVMKDADHLAIWMWLLMNAKFAPVDTDFGGERITLQPGQFITGRKTISNTLGVSESKVQRVLKRFESEHMIEQQTNRQGRLITIVSWDKFQFGEQHQEQQVNNNRTTSEQRVNTIKRKKEYKELNNHSHISKRIEDMTQEERDAFHREAMKRFYGD